MPFEILVCDIFLCFVIFPLGVLGQVCYLTVSIPDISIFPYLNNACVPLTT